MATTTHATFLRDYYDQLTEVLLGDSLLSTIRSALLDFEIKGDARDYQFTRMKGDVEAAVGQSVFEVEKGNKGFRVRLVKKGAKRATIEEKRLQEELKSVRGELVASEGKGQLAEEDQDRAHSIGMSRQEHARMEACLEFGPPADLSAFVQGRAPLRTQAAMFQLDQETCKTAHDQLVRLRKADSQPQEDLQTVNRFQMAITAAPTMTKEANTEAAILAAAEAAKQKVLVSSSSQTEDSTYLFVTIDHPDFECGLKIRKTALTDKLYRAMSLEYSMCEGDFNIFTPQFNRLERGHTMEQAQIEDGDRLTVLMAQKGGKPVIYLLPPSPLPEASVQLTLIPQWNFSAIYPVVYASTSVSVDRQSIEWTVSAEPGGMLVNKSDNQPTPYLYWEAVTTNKAPTSDLRFNPCTASLDPSNSMLLSIEDMVPHLQKTLEELSLNVQARTDFITYWLPSLNKHKYIALRFLPQHEYETAAPLTIEPKPDVVTRVFMLFKGVEGDDLAAWKRENSVDWKDVIGFTAAAEDEKIFRVLEWGGMEVLV